MLCRRCVVQNRQGLVGMESLRPKEYPWLDNDDIIMMMN